MNRIVMVLCLALAGCGASSSAAAPRPTTPSTTATTATSAEPAEPDRERLVLHLREHVSYPADRTALVTACAGTGEFVEAEQAWFAEHLPPGTYESADAVLSALR